VEWPSGPAPASPRSGARWLVAALLVLVAAGVATGAYLLTRSPGGTSNGLASKSPAQIVQAAVTAVKGASGFEMSGTGNFGDGVTAVDIKVRGADLDGTMTMDGSSLDFDVIGGNVYFNAPAAFWAAEGLPSSMTGAYAGTWIEAAAGSSTASGFSGVSSITDIASALENHGALAPGGTGSVNGQPVVFVKYTTSGAILAVATSGQAYPVRLSETSSSSTEVIDFSNWNNVAVFTPPPSPLAIPGS
jgi:hypothetical protein